MEFEQMEKKLKEHEEALILMAKNILRLCKIVDKETYEQVSKLYKEKYDLK